MSMSSFFAGSRQGPVVTGVFASASLALGFLLPWAGVALGLVTFWQIKRRGHTRWGLAVAGAGVLVGGVLWGASLADYTNAKNQPTSLYGLKRGACFDWPSKIAMGFHVKPVDCDRPHDGEVFGRFEATAMPDAFPGTAWLQALGDEKCVALRASYNQDLWSLSPDTGYGFNLPTAELWSRGSRGGVCYFRPKTDDERLRGSLRADAQTLNEHQLAYLEAENLANYAYIGSPAGGTVTEGLTAYRAWARRVAGAVEREERSLRAHDWPAEARPHVLALADELATAHEQWSGAGAATDAEKFKTHWYQAEEAFSGEAAVAARKALGLAHGDAWQPGGFFSR